MNFLWLQLPKWLLAHFLLCAPWALVGGWGTDQVPIWVPLGLPGELLSSEAQLPPLEHGTDSCSGHIQGAHC